MSSSVFDTPARRYAATLVALLAALCILGVAQNLHLLPGGRISLAKFLWLFSALALWIVTPIYVALEPRFSAGIRWCAKVFAVLFLARGVIELWMMFVTLNWSPLYGIAHDLCCLVFIVYGLAVFTPQSPADKVALGFFVLMAMMLPFEIFFAWYMKFVVQLKLGSTVYYVPNQPEYFFVLTVTWIAVVMALPLLIFNTRRWLHA